MTGAEWYRGRTAVVTGASSGIGAELARQLGRRGMRVALVARRAERLAALADEIRGAGGTSSAHTCDVADRVSVAAAGRDIRDRYDTVHLLANCAGYARHVLFQDHAEDDVLRMVQTNVMGTVHWIREVLPGMREQGLGWIVNVSSFAGLVAQPDEAVYTATKFAVTGLSDALAWELLPMGIHVLCVYPVLVKTEMFTPEILERMPPGTARRFITAERFAAETLRALERGAHHAVIPRSYRGVAILKALFPRWMGRKIAAFRLRAIRNGS